MPPSQSNGEIAVTRDSSSQREIPTAWRSVLAEIVRAFASQDYGLGRGVPTVEAVPADVAAHIGDYIRDYGATLVELPPETWETSVCMWYGQHWDALVDLWTREEGRSDLVLSVRVAPVPSGFSFTIHMVYVP